MAKVICRTMFNSLQNVRSKAVLARNGLSALTICTVITILVTSILMMVLQAILDD